MNAFGVVIRFGGQLIASAQATALQNFTTVFSGHAFAEAVHAKASFYFWLISTFWHLFPLKTPAVKFLTQPERICKLTFRFYTINNRSVKLSSLQFCDCNFYVFINPFFPEVQKTAL